MPSRTTVTSRRTRTVCGLAAAGIGLMLAAGCREAGVEEHRVPKGVETLPQSAPPTDGPVTEPERPVVRADSEWPWVAPAGWRAVPGERPMRLATYEIPVEGAVDGGAVEVAVTRFPGDVGGMLANVNRWRGQIGLPPVGQDDLDALLEPFENPGFAGVVMRLEGLETHMLAASIHEAAMDRTWFVRVSGDPDQMDLVEAEVFAFARSFGRAE